MDRQDWPSLVARPTSLPRSSHWSQGRANHSCRQASRFTTRECHDRIRIEPFCGMPPKLLEAAGRLLSISPYQHYATIRSSTEVDLASGHNAKQFSHRFWDCHLPLGCCCRCHAVRLTKLKYFKSLASSAAAGARPKPRCDKVIAVRYPNRNCS